MCWGLFNFARVWFWCRQKIIKNAPTSGEIIYSLVTLTELMRKYAGGGFSSRYRFRMPKTRCATVNGFYLLHVSLFLFLKYKCRLNETCAKAKVENLGHKNNTRRRSFKWSRAVIYPFYSQSQQHLDSTSHHINSLSGCTRVNWSRFTSGKFKIGGSVAKNYTNTHSAWISWNEIRFLFKFISQSDWSQIMHLTKLST